MITKEQATDERNTEFHAEGCKTQTGPRGGKQTQQVRFRRAGKTQVWKRSPEKFRIPIKYGLREWGEITELNAHHFHTAEDCPLNQEEE